VDGSLCVFRLIVVTGSMYGRHIPVKVNTDCAFVVTRPVVMESPQFTCVRCRGAYDPTLPPPLLR